MADNEVCGFVYCLLKEGEALVAKTNDGCLNLYLVAEEYRMEEVGIDVCHYRHHAARTEIFGEYFREVFFLAEVVVGEVGVVVDMAEAIHIVEADLYVGLVMEVDIVHWEGKRDEALPRTARNSLRGRDEVKG